MWRCVAGNWSRSLRIETVSSATHSGGGGVHNKIYKIQAEESFYILALPKPPLITFTCFLSDKVRHLKCFGNRNRIETELNLNIRCNINI